LLLVIAALLRRLVALRLAVIALLLAVIALLRLRVALRFRVTLLLAVVTLRGLRVVGQALLVVAGGGGLRVVARRGRVALRRVARGRAIAMRVAVIAVVVVRGRRDRGAEHGAHGCSNRTTHRRADHRSHERAG